MLIDTHAHLDDARFDEDREHVIQQIRQDGLDCVINPGADMVSSRKAVELAHAYEFIYAAVGVHPQDAEHLNDVDLAELERLAKDDRVVAIGEIGLDYHYDEPGRDVQKVCFESQLKLADRAGKPVIIHDRDAHGDMMNILKSRGKNQKGVLHCFSGSVEMAEECLKLGFLISFTGNITFKNARRLIDVVKAIPIELIMIETDSPYLSPEPHRGQRNYPGNVRYVAEKIADIKGMQYDDVVRITGHNAVKLFGLTELGKKSHA
ncbi:TatD family hydrolase [Mahella sp.]|uniref:TatD family hydrolase n=1 Tax=Mahella sp. TaxID=2798721 RepID=UPI0025BBA6D5|nr:TatD family hydrolase [Mahella sp.]MBZ4665601.1 hydrolase, TatD family [Mahella sp.]